MGIQEKTKLAIDFVIVQFGVLKEMAMKIFEEIKAFWAVW